MSTDDARIVDLEVRYMHVEKMMSELSDVLIEQQKTIDRLSAEVAMLRERLPQDAGDSRTNEPPPHY